MVIKKCSLGIRRIINIPLLLVLVYSVTFLLHQYPTVEAYTAVPDDITPTYKIIDGTWCSYNTPNNWCEVPSEETGPVNCQTNVNSYNEASWITGANIDSKCNAWFINRGDYSIGISKSTGQKYYKFDGQTLPCSETRYEDYACARITVNPSPSPTRGVWNSPTPSPSSKLNYNFTGYVKDSNGSPVQGVEVYVHKVFSKYQEADCTGLHAGCGSTRTNSNGNYSITCSSSSNDPVVDYRITSGYTSGSLIVYKKNPEGYVSNGVDAMPKGSTGESNVCFGGIWGISSFTGAKVDFSIKKSLTPTEKPDLTISPSIKPSVNPSGAPSPSVKPCTPGTEGCGCATNAQGDANCDGKVCLNDYLEYYKATNGQTVQYDVDFNNDGFIGRKTDSTSGDYEIWLAGNTSSLGVSCGH